MKILVTGAAGHIGSSLIRFLPRLRGLKKIYLLDNFLSKRYCSFFNLKSNKYQFLNLDLSKCSIKDIPKSNITIHLASKTDAAQSAKFKNEFYSNNIPATKKIMKYCLKNKSKLIFASSTSVYGPQSDTVDENCSKKELRPQNPYASIKLKEEKMIRDRFKKENNSFVILRLGTIYGFSPGIRFQTAVNKFFFQASLNLPLTVWRTALHQRRPYLSLGDFNKSIMHIINKRLFLNDTYNVLTKNLSVFEIINIIKNIKRKIKIIKVDHEIMNQLSYNVSNKKFIKTNFHFTSHIQKDIKETLNILKNINN